MTPNPAAWPTLPDLGTIARLQILAAAHRHAAYVETVIDRPFRSLWDEVADIEKSVPTFDATVHRLTVTERTNSGAPLRATATPFLFPFPIALNIDLRSGWCLMNSRSYMVGFAAEPLTETTTRYAHLEGFSRRASSPIDLPLQLVQRAVAPFLRRHVRNDIQGVQRLAEGRLGLKE